MYVPFIMTFFLFISNNNFHIKTQKVFFLIPYFSNYLAWNNTYQMENSQIAFRNVKKQISSGRLIWVKLFDQSFGFLTFYSFIYLIRLTKHDISLFFY